MAKNQRSHCVNNKSILKTQLKYKESYKKYKEKMLTTKSDIDYIREKMKDSGYTGHFFSIRYPDFEKAYVVFEHVPPTDPMLYGQLMLVDNEKDKKSLLGLLPNYWLMIDDLKEGEEEPPQEKVAEYVQEFYNYWFDINKIDEKDLQKRINEDKNND